MFKGISDMMSLMGKAKEMQSRMGEIQDKLAQTRIRGSAGNGMVSVEVNGKFDVLSCQIDQSLVDGDRARLEEMVVSAMNDAMFRARKTAAEMMQEMSGMDLPGMGDAFSKMGLG